MSSEDKDMSPSPANDTDKAYMRFLDMFLPGRGNKESLMERVVDELINLLRNWDKYAKLQSEQAKIKLARERERQKQLEEIEEEVIVEEDQPGKDPVVVLHCRDLEDAAGSVLGSCYDVRNITICDGKLYFTTVEDFEPDNESTAEEMKPNDEPTAEEMELLAGSAYPYSQYLKDFCDGD